MALYPLEYYEFFIKFNEGDYYTCHDLLEAMWLAEKDNFFLKGLLQMSVALYHYEYGNVKGARMMMEAGCKYLHTYKPFHWGLNVERISEYMEGCLTIMPKDVTSVPFEQIYSLPRLPALFLYLEE